MARQRAAAKYLGFPKGLNTETSLLNPAEGTTADELNMDLRLNKLIRARRLGLENVGTTKSTVGNVIGGYYWDAADVFIVVSLKDETPETYDTVTLYLYDGDLTYIEDWSIRLVDGKGVYPNFSEIRNRLVVTFGAKPFVLAKQETCFDIWTLDLFIRDFKLLDDDLGISERPTSAMTDAHKYNVYNAGWYQDVQISGGAEDNAADSLFTGIAEYPSNADILSLGISSDSSGTTIFNPQSFETALTGNSEAPRGHYVYNIREIDRQNRNNGPLTDGVPSSTITKVVSCGFNVTGLGGNLIFVDAVPSGESTDPAPPTGGGGGGSVPDDPFFWEKP